MRFNQPDHARPRAGARLCCVACLECSRPSLVNHSEMKLISARLRFTRISAALEESPSRLPVLENDHVIRVCSLHSACELSRLCVLQAAGENPDIHCHHRCNAKYNQVFHVFTSFLRLVLKSEAPVPVEQCARHSLDTDDPSDRNCSRRQLQSRGLGAWQAARFATAAWAVWLRLVTRELFSSMLLFWLQDMAVVLAALGLDWLLLCINCVYDPKPILLRLRNIRSDDCERSERIA